MALIEKFKPYVKAYVEGKDCLLLFSSCCRKIKMLFFLPLRFISTGHGRDTEEEEEARVFAFSHMALDVRKGRKKGHSLSITFFFENLERRSVLSEFFCVFTAEGSGTRTGLRKV